MKRLEQVIKPLLPASALATIVSARSERSLKAFLRNGGVPWSLGYDVYKRRLISEVIADEDVLERFRRDDVLPAGYGMGVDERCIEYPWLVAHLPDRSRVLLDAGSTLNHEFILDHPILRDRVIHIVTLAPEAQCFWDRGVSYLFHDLRDLPIRDEYYDAVVCLSTLEHVGCDNARYTHDASHREDRPDDCLRAVGELRRVLKPGGSLFLTVPFGAYRHFGSFQQFDREMLSRAVEAFGEALETEAFYRYTARGWERSTPEECRTCEYVEWITRDPWPDPLPVEPDRAAAARAVACLHLIRG